MNSVKNGAIKFLLLISIAMVHSAVFAEIYSYTNDSGRKIYVDRLSKIPGKYRKQVNKRVLNVTENSETEQAVYDAENKALEKKLMITNVIARLEKSIENITSKVFISRNQVLVPVEIKRGSRVYPLNLLLDTGANVTVIHSDALPFFKKDNRNSSYAKIANGSVIQTWSLSLPSIKFGPYNRNNHQVMVLEHKGGSRSDGLLGMDLLSQTNYQINFDEQSITWDQNKVDQLRDQISTLKIQLR